MHDVCVICLEILHKNNIKMLECSHCFCFCCINLWNNNHNSCPLCRSLIKKTPEYVEANEYYIEHIMQNKISLLC